MRSSTLSLFAGSMFWNADRASAGVGRVSSSEFVRQGLECDASGDLGGAERAFRAADELQDPEGSILLGFVLERRGEISQALEAFHRAEARGHREAASSIGNIFWRQGDWQSARTAFERSVAAGSSGAVLNLGLLLAEQGLADDALQHLRVAQESGAAPASWAIGRLLEDRGDFKGAEEAFRRGASGGNPDAAFGLGRVLVELNDREGARTAFRHALELGHNGAARALDAMMSEDVAAQARASVGAGVKCAQLYAAACGDVLAAANVCLEVVNRVAGFVDVATQRPQAEISIRNFMNLAEQAEREFPPVYERFVEACAKAREAAGQLLATQQNPGEAEVVLSSSLEQSVLNNVATAKALLEASFGPTTSSFIQGIEAANVRMKTPTSTAIYTPPSPAPRDAHTCPSCAETIQAAAVICRFCGSGIPTQP